MCIKYICVQLYDIYVVSNMVLMKTMKEQNTVIILLQITTTIKVFYCIYDEVNNACVVRL